MEHLILTKRTFHTTVRVVCIIIIALVNYGTSVQLNYTTTASTASTASTARTASTASTASTTSTATATKLLVLPTAATAARAAAAANAAATAAATALLQTNSSTHGMVRLFTYLINWYGTSKLVCFHRDVPPWQHVVHGTNRSRQKSGRGRQTIQYQ